MNGRAGLRECPGLWTPHSCILGGSEAGIRWPTASKGSLSSVLLTRLLSPEKKMKVLGSERREGRLGDIIVANYVMYCSECVTLIPLIFKTTL